MFADVSFEGIRAIYTFQKLSLSPLLKGLLNPSPREQAVVGLHYRIASYLASLFRLNGPVHFQAIAASARSLFELGLDMALFHKDTSDESLNRLHAFTRVERYRVATKLVDFYTNKPLPDNLDLTIQRSLCGDPKEKMEVEALIQKYWSSTRKGGPLWPKHWSRFQETRGRACFVGGTWEGWYVQNYYMLSWHIHSGITGILDLPQDAFDYFVMEAFQLSTDAVVESYKIIGRELHLERAIPKWPETIAFLDRVIGLALVDKRLQSLGEPHRFCYLEEHEKGIA
jgi:hypothetical protein